MTEVNSQLNQFEEPKKIEEKTQDVQQENSIVEKKKAKKKDDSGLKVIDNPIRNLPSVINEVLEKNFSVILTKTGYYIEGFYGLGVENGTVGFAFGQETNEPNVLIFFDSKGHKHVIKSFEDLVKFNNHVWGVFYKISDEYKKPNHKWFGYMLELGVLNITPGGK